tara:strand:+ start:681 stop:2030 length:1350 start_codon:yes stop_codon:yes gene_type:complete
MNFIKKIFSFSCLTASLFLLIYTFYKSEIHYNGEKSDYYFTYYVVSSVFILFSIITFFISDKIKEYLIISCLSLTVSLYIFEGYFSLNSQPPQAKIYEKETGKKWDSRQRTEIYRDLKKINNNIKVTVHPSYFLNKNTNIFPLSGISNSETIYCNESGYFSIYQSDRYGFNNPDEEWDSKEVEYLLVGDSMVQGACVNRPNDIGSVLRIISNKSVLNLGYGGNAPLTQYATLREYLKPNVKKVLFSYVDNDSGGLVKEINAKNKILENYLNDLTFTQNLILRQKEVDIIGNDIIQKEYTKIKKEKELKFLKLNYIREKLNSYLPEKYRPYENYRLTPLPAEEFKRVLKLTKDLTSQNNSELYFVYLPLCERYKTKVKGCYYKKGEYDDSNYQLLKKIVNELDIPFVDIHTEVFLKQKNPTKLFPFELNKHYNVEGFEKTAKGIYKLTRD